MYYRAYINFCIQKYIKNCKNNNNNNNNFVIFFFCSPLCISNYLSYNKLFWIRLHILPYFSCDLFVLREFKGKMIRSFERSELERN